MYRPQAFAVDDRETLHAVIRSRAFATIAAVHDGAVHLAYAPVVLDGGGLGTLRFHLARENALCGAAGARVKFSFLETDAYVSPDWYESRGRVPTWNYIAVEAEGIVQRLDRGELRELLADLSADQEGRLNPKIPWTMAKLAEPRLEALLNAIEGFSVRLDRLEGKFKLSQNMNAADRAGVIAALEARGDARSMQIATAMRKVVP